MSNLTKLEATIANLATKKEDLDVKVNSLKIKFILHKFILLP